MKGMTILILSLSNESAMLKVVYKPEFAPVFYHSLVSTR
ncbi:hypothetical protein HPSD74_1876 [Glaesserella parasuis D74]|nr:hypothetical protein HPSD74_1876 [Glaesserella parasuis D74]